MPPHPTASELVAAARAWLAAGWHPIPLTGHDGKAPAQAGLIGHDATDLTEADITQAFSNPWVGALGLRMPEGVLGLDIDGYDGKQGPEALAALLAELGIEALPPTASVSGRLDGRSGIHFYRVPPVLAWSAAPLDGHGGGVDLVHRNHRHAKAWPSVHHKTGLTLGRLDLEPGQLVALDDGGEPWLLPPPDELPDLPPELVAALTSRKAATGSRDAVEWSNLRGMDGQWSVAVEAAWRQWEGRGKGSRYEAMRNTQAALVRLDSLGQAGATAALLQLQAEYVAAVPERDAEAEYSRALEGAIGKVAGSESLADQARRLVARVFRPFLEGAQAEPVTSSVTLATNLPDEFWEARPQLAHIRAAAWSRLRSPDAVLAATLARLSALTPPLYRLPATVGSPSTVSMFAALVGPSGTGKTTAAYVARELLPIGPMQMDKVVEHSLGSGEGLVELYMGDADTGEMNSRGNPIKERQQVRQGAIVTLDEGAALTEMGGRKGATMLPTLRSMWTGAPAGQANAQKENSRRLESLGYTLGFIVGIQPSLAAELLGDTAAGTPQRFVWASTIDPKVPTQRPPWPGPLAHRMPSRPKDGRAVPELVLAPEIVSELTKAALEAVRGVSAVDPLESHRNLLRLKTAGLLAILEGRLDVTEGDWALAGVVVDTSTAVREAVQAVISAEAEGREAQADRREARRAKVRAEAEAETAEGRAQRLTEQAARGVARAVRKPGAAPMAPAAARRAIRSTWRKDVDLADVIAYGVEQCWLVEAEGKLNPGPVEA